MQRFLLCLRFAASWKADAVRQLFHLHRTLVMGPEIFVLDSGHVVEYNDPRQIDMLASSSSRPAMGDKGGSFEAAPACRVAVYHVPIFPSEDTSWDSQLGFMTAPREYWLPEFQRLGVSLAFENHVHTMKKTPPLLPSGKPTVHHVDNPASEGGTVYLGDGRWGISSGSKDPTSSQVDDSTSQRATALPSTLLPRRTMCGGLSLIRRPGE